MKRLRPWKQGDSITAKRLNEIQAHIPGKITGGPGINVLRAGGSNDIVISLAGRNPRSYVDEFWAEIRDYTAVPGDINQWHYGFYQRVIKWTAEDGYYLAAPADNAINGISNDIASCAINLAELNNDNDGIEGNGINVDDLNAGLSIQPIAVGSVVRMHREPISGLGENDREYIWAFTAHNAIDGTCV